eukprot:NODE_135_length_16508_cov_1.365897.p14 type:complete len:162 gc:universal NODE_135_length_16508_cov_1.365897:12273-12758(+)
MTKLYIPSLNDNVIGIVETKLSSEYYRLNINSTQTAIISNLDFKKAVKRNKQQLEEGDAVFAKLMEIVPDPLLSCKETDGLLLSGMIVKVNCAFCREFPKYNAILQKIFQFKCLVGLNGFIHIESEDSAILLVLYNILQKGQYFDENEFKKLVYEATNKNS